MKMSDAIDATATKLLRRDNKLIIDTDGVEPVVVRQPTQREMLLARLNARLVVLGLQPLHKG